MDLVNEYLRTVAALLPKAQREDIIAELRDTILSGIEAREGDLGRPLTDDEVEAELREVGHPLVIAARYREGPQHVVGPTLYPYWLFAVKASIALQVAIAVVVVIVRTLAFGDFPLMLGQAIGSGITGALVFVGAATATVWVLERRGQRIDYLETWRVRDLRLLEIATWDVSSVREWVVAWRARPRRERVKSQAWRRDSPIAHGLALIVVGTALILWWTGVLSPGLSLSADDLRRLDISPGALAAFQWSGFKAVVFWFVLVYMAALVLQGALLLAWPGVQRLQGAIEAIRGAMLLAFCVWLNTASPLAPSLNVSSFPDLIQRMAMLAHSPPVPLEPIVVIFVLSMAFSGLVLFSRGLWTLATSGPRAQAEAGISKSA
ncbi:hypothetical protein [Phenylobacterium sp.]|uniref:hypothetical protein n=1 Tax=Phenylobacterium sp. TaxID=1871053 RepID=UPI001223BFC4|nr:hypothetical protein [Phenylobacterium sp.]THD60116.1 MAG: hypothetical protein E8A12_11005 [Phenylobacterium sp.]